MLGVDYSFARPGAANIKAAGYQFVCRYLASSAGKAITSAEYDDLLANELAVVLVFEDYANQSLNGHAQGVADAQEALSQANALGFPADRPIYFAVDFDASEAQQGAIDAYLQGCASVLGINRVGVYGGFYVVSRCAANGTAKWFWQTLAWSGGQHFSGNHIYQNGQSAFGSGADVDEAVQLDYGQWPQGEIDMITTANDLKYLYLGVYAQDVPDATLATDGFIGKDFGEVTQQVLDYANKNGVAYWQYKAKAEQQIADLQAQLAAKPTPAPTPPTPIPPVPTPTPVKKHWWQFWL